MDVLTTLMIASAVVLVSYLLSLIGNRGKQSNLPPSPPTWPLVGNLPLIIFSSKRLDIVTTELGKQYGGMFTLWFGPLPAVFITDAEICRDALVNKAAVFSNRLTSPILKMISDSYKGIAFAPYGKQLTQKRKWSHQVMKTLLLDDQADGGDAIKNECKALLQRLTDLNGKPINIKDDIFKALIRITSMACFGPAFANNQDKINEIRTMLDYLFRGGTPGLFMLHNICPYLINFPFFKLNYLSIYKNMMTKMMKEETEKRAKSSQESNDMLECFTKSGAESDKDTAKESFFHDQEEKERIVGDIFIGGSETVSVTLLWCILTLAKYPKLQQTMRDEIERIRKTEKGLQHSIVSDFPYIRAFYSEVLRYITIVPFPVFHLTASDMSFRGYNLPLKTTIIPNFHAIHHDDKVWAKPQEFQPERFLKEDGTFFIPNKSFMPFSIGPRVCIGELVAKKEIVFTLVYLVLSFNILPSKEGLPGFEEDLIGSVLSPKPYKIVLKARNEELD